MKCDKLKRFEIVGKYTDDETIGECYDADEVDAAIAELKAKLKESEEARYEAGADAADYYQENRNLKRTLWLTRAEKCHRFDVDRYLRNHRNSWYNENCLTWNDACVAMDVKMCKAECKCRVKAEEYK
jgi:hypothetical protein